MRQDTLVLIVATIAVMVGLGLMWSGARPHHPTVRVASHRRHSWSVTTIAAAVVFAVSGWLGPSLVIGCVVSWLIGVARRRSSGDAAGVDRTEALAAWVENVRDVLRAGNQPVGAIGATTASCPPLIRPAVLSLFARLSAGQPADVCFRRFADDLDDPLADLIAVGLLIAVTRGAESDEVLSALATQARHQADRRRIVEAERAPMRREVLMVSVIMCALLGIVFAFSRSSYLHAYDRPGGQVFLTVVLLGYGALLLWVGRLASFPRPARFLTLGDGR